MLRNSVSAPPASTSIEPVNSVVSTTSVMATVPTGFDQARVVDGIVAARPKVIGSRRYPRRR